MTPAPKRPHFRERFVQQAYKMMADDLRPKPPPKAAPAPQEVPADVSADDLASLVGG